MKPLPIPPSHTTVGKHKKRQMMNKYETLVGNETWIHHDTSHDALRPPRFGPPSINTSSIRELTEWFYILRLQNRKLYLSEA
jgi:hypothetical protein